MEQHYLDVNKSLWNKKVAHHVQSDFYDMQGFLLGRNSLKEVELALLGDVKGKSILHLQCHFGQDTISLSRMGAQSTGVDFSDTAIEKGRELAGQLGTNTTFICTDIYSLPEVSDKQYDIVFTSYGTIGWLPDMDRWAGVVAQSLKPGGRFVFVDFHPVLWMFDNEFTRFEFAYFNREAIVETQEGTYADRNAPLQETEIGWNHSLSEVLNALLGQGLSIKFFGEYDYSPYDCFRHTEEFELGKFRIRHLENKIPMLYSIVAEKSK